MSLIKVLLKESRYWGTIGAGILPYCSTTRRFLINHRSGDVLEPNTWGTWGGKLDEGIEEEHEIEGVALREFEEESGFNGSIDLHIIYIFKASGNVFKYYNYLGIVNEEFEPQLDWESQGFEWLTMDDLLSLSNNKLKHKKIHFGLKALIKNGLDKIKRLL